MTFQELRLIPKNLTKKRFRFRKRKLYIFFPSLFLPSSSTSSNQLWYNTLKRHLRFYFLEFDALPNVSSKCLLIKIWIKIIILDFYGEKKKDYFSINYLPPTLCTIHLGFPVVPDEYIMNKGWSKVTYKHFIS